MNETTMIRLRKPDDTLSQREQMLVRMVLQLLRETSDKDKTLTIRRESNRTMVDVEETIPIPPEGLQELLESEDYQNITIKRYAGVNKSVRRVIRRLL